MRQDNWNSFKKQKKRREKQHFLTRSGHFTNIIGKTLAFMFFIQENNRLLIDYTTSRLLAFAYNAKSFEIFIIFILIFFSTANLDDLTKIACRIFYIFKAGWVSSNSDTLHNTSCLILFWKCVISTYLAFTKSSS